MPLLGEADYVYGRQAGLATEELPQGRGEVSATLKKFAEKVSVEGEGRSSSGEPLNVLAFEVHF